MIHETRVGTLTARGSTTKQFGFSFTFDAPTVWNSLPEDIRASPTIASFRKKLKTYLYAKAYPP